MEQFTLDSNVPSITSLRPQSPSFECIWKPLKKVKINGEKINSYVIDTLLQFQL